MTGYEYKSGAAARRYFRNTVHPLASKPAFLRWALSLPLRSMTGARAIAAYTEGTCPSEWLADFGGSKRTLVVGSGPSLDRVDKAFFDDFDTIVYINFALNRARGIAGEYFFTTDAGPIREFIDAHGVNRFARLGPKRCVFAPVFLDQWHAFTDEGRALLTWLGCDDAGWRIERKSLGPLTVPLVMRYYPRQPEWDSFELPTPSRKISVLDHTSALSAVLFAAINGSRTIGLIGCDFSTGRAASVASDQADPGAAFSRAATEFRAMAAALERNGVNAVNFSWVV